MQINRASDYAIRGVLRMAHLGKADWVMVTDVAKSEQLPIEFMAKLFRLLVLGGILQSSRGRMGGFALARPANQITVWDIIQVVEGRDKISHCLNDNHNCDKLPACAVREVMGRAQTALEDIFKGVTIADLMAKDKKRSANK